jgi:hypothetical protein
LLDENTGTQRKPDMAAPERLARGNASAVDPGEDWNYDNRRFDRRL